MDDLPACRRASLGLFSLAIADTGSAPPTSLSCSVARVRSYSEHGLGTAQAKHENRCMTFVKDQDYAMLVKQSRSNPLEVSRASEDTAPVDADRLHEDGRNLRRVSRQNVVENA